MTDIITSWNTLLNRLKKLQNEFIHLTELLEESKRGQPGVCGKWSPKQMIAHFSAWDKEVVRQFGLFQDGLQQAIEYDMDEFNRKAVQERSHLNWNETIAELKDAQREFNQIAGSISPKEISDNQEFIDWMEVQIEHYEHHIGQLREWI